MTKPLILRKKKEYNYNVNFSNTFDSKTYHLSKVAGDMYCTLRAGLEVTITDIEHFNSNKSAYFIVVDNPRRWHTSLSASKFKRIKLLGIKGEVTLRGYLSSQEGYSYLGFFYYEREKDKLCFRINIDYFAYIKSVDHTDHIKIPNEEVNMVQDVVKKDTAVVSDGGVSSYYKIPFESWQIELINSQGYLMVDDLCESMFKDEFNFTTAFKCLYRGYQTTQGKGKFGNPLGYDMKKVKYSVDRIVVKGARL